MQNYQRVTYACYFSNICMAVVGNLSPLLFSTFRAMYGISYTLLGLLILINFCTQLFVDILFSLFSDRFNITLAVKGMPVLTLIGFSIYAICPMLFPNAVYAWLVAGTIIFAASSGLAEVLVSPVVAAIPSDNTDRALSILHSSYAWGVVGVVLASTLFLRAFGAHNWPLLVLLLLCIPITACVLFRGTTLPPMQSHGKANGVGTMLKSKYLRLCIVCIFLGGASECVMAQWSSSFLEQSLAIPKVWGDVFGVALFAAMLGTGRSLYAKFGKNIYRTMMYGAIGATLCYLVAIFSANAVASIFACALTGLCVSMLWPGSLILASNKFADGGVAMFALMAMGGDLGAAVGPQLVGVLTDFALQQKALLAFGASAGLSAEQISIKFGLLVGVIFPLIAIFLYYRVWRGATQTETQS